MIVVDASVVTTALADDGEEGDFLRGRLEGRVLYAPEVLDLEVISSWRGQMRAGKLIDQRVRQALDDLYDMPLLRAPHRQLATRVWELRDNLSAYDGSYVALAEALRIPLVTTDARLARAPGVRCEVEVLAA